MTRAAAIKHAAARKGEGAGAKETSGGWLRSVVSVGSLIAVSLAVQARFWAETRGGSHAEVSASSGSEEQAPEDQALELLQDVLSFNSERGEKGFKGFSKAEYWDERYKKSDRPYDWYSSWEKIGPLVAEHMPPLSGAILNVGCGNSRLPQELHDVGYKDVTSIDYSPAVIEQMQHKHADLGQKFLFMDMTSMTFANESFDLVVDKGALDALYTGAHDKVFEAVPEFFRVLKPGGIYFSITFGEAARRKELRQAPWASFETLVLARSPQAHYIHVAKKAA